MSKTKQRVTIAAAGALFLGGSGVAVAAADLPVPGSPAEEASATPQGASPAADATAEAEEPTALKDQFMTIWLNGLGHPSLDSLASALPDDSPMGSISGYHMGQPGELVISVSGNWWTHMEARGLANSFMISVGPEHDELKAVTVETESGDVSASDLRSENIQVD